MRAKENSRVDRNAGVSDRTRQEGTTDDYAGLPDEIKAFYSDLTSAGHPIWAERDRFPAGWPNSSVEENAEQLQRHAYGRGSHVCAVMAPGAFAVVDVDAHDDGPAGDLDAVSVSLTGAGVTVAAVVATGGGGWHLYVPGSPRHQFDRTDAFRNFPGVDLKASGSVFLPGSHRVKHNHLPYTLHRSNLAAVLEDVDSFTATQEAFAAWLDANLVDPAPADRAPDTDIRLPESPDEIAQVCRQIAAAIAAEVAEVAKAPVGTRDSTLIAKVAKLARYAYLEHVNDGEVILGERVRGAMREACEVNGLLQELDASEFDRKFDRQWDYGATRPRAVPFSRVGDDLSAVFDGDPLLAAPGTRAVPADPFDMAVQKRLEELKVREAAQRLHKSSQAGTQEKPPVTLLSDFLAIPDEDVRYRIDRLWPKGGRGMLAAAAKSGKTTLTGNVIRSLVDGEPFLERYPVEQARNVVLIDDELDPRTLRAWLRDQEIQNTDRVRVVTLRGRTGTFDLLDPLTRSEWAAQIRGADVVILDCLRPVLDALGLDESREAGRFLVAFDALLADSGAEEALMVHHMGHGQERSRGDSRLIDWPDMTWKMMLADDKNPASARFMSAYGRDVVMDKTELILDPFSRRLRLGESTWLDMKADGMVTQILKRVADKPGLSQSDLKKSLEGDNNLKGPAIEKACLEGLIERRPRAGRGGGFSYFLLPI